MKKLLFIISLFISCYGYAQNIPLTISQTDAQPNSPVFSSAEERIVFNKEQQRPKYEGVEIMYIYRLQELPGHKVARELQTLAETQFLQVLDVSYQKTDSKLTLCIRTNGHRKNHDIYNQLLEQHPRWLGRENRQYFLK